MRRTVFLLFFFIPHLLVAQFVIEKNLKTILPATLGQSGIVPIGKDGLVIFYEAINHELYDTRKWEIIHLDTNFESKMQSSFESDINFYIKQVKYHEGFLYLFFKDRNNPIRSVIFAKFNLMNKKIDFFQINAFLPEEISGFEVLGNSLFLVGIDEQGPSIIKYRFGDPRPNVLQGFYTENNELLSTELLPELNVLQIITRIKKQKEGSNSKIILVKHFDEFGDIRKELLLESSKGYDLINALAKTDTDGNTCVVGTYSYGKSKFSNGIFTKTYNKDIEHPLYYYNYTSLHNYFNYLSLRDQEKLRKKHDKTQAKGKIPDYKENHVTRELVKTGDSWQYLGEVVSLIDRKLYVYGYTDPREYLQYSHAVVLGISSDGKLKWDNIIDMERLKTVSSSQQVRMHSFDDRSILFYKNELSLTYKVIAEEVDVLEKSTFDLDYAGDMKVKDHFTNNGKLARWYDNKFINFELYVVNSLNKNSGLFLILNKLSPKTNIQEP